MSSLEKYNNSISNETNKKKNRENRNAPVETNENGRRGSKSNGLEKETRADEPLDCCDRNQIDWKKKPE